MLANGRQEPTHSRQRDERRARAASKEIDSRRWRHLAEDIRYKYQTRRQQTADSRMLDSKEPDSRYMTADSHNSDTNPDTD
jgi:hypothetical protein